MHEESQWKFLALPQRSILEPRWEKNEPMHLNRVSSSEVKRFALAKLLVLAEVSAERGQRLPLDAVRSSAFTLVLARRTDGEGGEHIGGGERVGGGDERRGRVGREGSHAAVVSQRLGLGRGDGERGGVEVG